MIALALNIVALGVIAYAAFIVLLIIYAVLANW